MLNKVSNGNSLLNMAMCWVCCRRVFENQHSMHHTMHPQAMLNKVSTGNSLLDVVMCFVLPLALRWLVPHMQALFEYITKVCALIVL